MQPEVCAALLEPPPFQPSKLEVTLLPGAHVARTAAPPPAPRRYTLTHNDLTGALRLSIGSDFNKRQMGGLYTRLLRDEVTAEWQYSVGSPGGGAVLHVYCHVSGAEFWLAPPQLRNYIFRREMALVLDTFVFADRALLAAYPHLAAAQVHCHFASHVDALQRSELWGVLGDRSTWCTLPTQPLERLKLLVWGFPLPAAAVVATRPRSGAGAVAAAAPGAAHEPVRSVGGAAGATGGEPALPPAPAAAAAFDVASTTAEEQHSPVGPVRGALPAADGSTMRLAPAPLAAVAVVTPAVNASISSADEQGVPVRAAADTLPSADGAATRWAPAPTGNSGAGAEAGGDEGAMMVLGRWVLSQGALVVLEERQAAAQLRPGGATLDADSAPRRVPVAVAARSALPPSVPQAVPR